jgi:peroxiredoxin
MRKVLAFIVLMLTWTTSSYAALDVGDAAPNFTATAALAGKQFKFTLAESLAKGPVVLYFFPAAFSVGCSIEAHEFAEAIGRFEALGATVTASRRTTSRRSASSRSRLARQVPGRPTTPRT